MINEVLICYRKPYGNKPHSVMFGDFATLQQTLFEKKQKKKSRLFTEDYNIEINKHINMLYLSILSP